MAHSKHMVINTLFGLAAALMLPAGTFILSFASSTFEMKTLALGLLLVGLDSLALVLCRTRLPPHHDDEYETMAHQAAVEN